MPMNIVSYAVSSPMSPPSDLGIFCGEFTEFVELLKSIKVAQA